MDHRPSALQSLIDGCKSIRQAQQIHAQILTSPDLPRGPLLGRLLLFCAASAAAPLAYASSIFRHLPAAAVSAYNSIIRAHARAADTAVGTLPLYIQMLRRNIRPDNLTFPFLLKAATRTGDSAAGRTLHGQVLTLGFSANIFVQNVMIIMYSEFHDLGCARKMFDEMAERDMVSWNSLVTGFLRCGDLDGALDMFETMSERNIISWNSIITGLVQGGRAGCALALFHEMLVVGGDDGVAPDGFTLASVITACGMVGALDQGRWVHGYLKIYGVELDAVIGTALVDMYGKCGSIERAVHVFREMEKKDVLAWTAMIKVFGDHGFSKEALCLFREMEMWGVKPNQVTFVALLCACAHSGLVERGRWIFDSMRDIYGIEPEAQHYACMVDLLSRAGLFGEAVELIRSMIMAPDVYVWGALLGACRMHGNVELGEKVAQHLIDLEPHNHAFYVALCDIYANARKFEDAKRIRALMRQRGVSKDVPGCSMIEIGGIVHEFSVKGSNEVLMSEIDWVLKGFASDWRLEGYAIDSEALLETD